MSVKTPYLLKSKVGMFNFNRSVKESVLAFSNTVWIGSRSSTVHQTSQSSYIVVCLKL